jgi:hypothetical protein
MSYRLASIVCAALIVVSCGGSQDAKPAANPGSAQPAPAPAGAGTSVNLTVSGAVTASSTQLAPAKDNKCADMAAAKMISTYAMNLYPIVDGKTTHVAVMVGKFTGPAELSIPADVGRLTLYYSVGEDEGNGTMYMSGKSSTGTVSLTESGGAIDVKGLKAMLGAGAVDMKATWRCGS